MKGRKDLKDPIEVIGDSCYNEGADKIYDYRHLFRPEEKAEFHVVGFSHEQGNTEDDLKNFNLK